MANISKREWVKNRVAALRDGADELKEIRPEAYNSFGPWSALKLILHATTINMYTDVISSHKDDFFYIDPLAGSGISLYSDEEYDIEEYFLGSAISAARAASVPFTKMYFIEKDDDFAEALERRLEAAFQSDEFGISQPGDYEVLHGDANDRINEVVNDMWKIAQSGKGGPNFNHITFIDNQGLDFHWNSVEQIAPKPTGDLLINFPSTAVNRAAGHADSRGAMNDFFGGDMWSKTSKSKEELLNLYSTRLSGLEKDVQVTANVHSGIKNFEYDLIYGTRETSGGSGYSDAVTYVKNFIEAVDGADVEDMVKVVRGDRVTMDAYLPDDDTDDQSTLRGFE